MIELSAPQLQGNELRYLEECIRSNWVSSAGKFVTRFEEEIASRVGTRYAVATINGTAALHVSLLISGLKKNEEVIVPTLTFIAPINVVTYCDAHPVFMDCDEYMNMDVKKVRRFLESECVAQPEGTFNRKTGRRIHSILPVHIFGCPVDMDPLLRLAETYRLKVIEDATESLGSRYKGRPTGALASLGCFSFNGNKIITTGGGGMIVTDDQDLARRARYLTTQAKDDDLYSVHDQIGYNYRLSNVQAAIGVAQMEQLAGFLETKKKNYRIYKERLSQIPGLSLLDCPPESDSNFWFYTLVIDPEIYGQPRDVVLKRLSVSGIQARPVWTLNHQQRPYLEAQAFDIKRAPDLQGRSINLPCSPSLTEGQIDQVVAVLKNR